MMTFIKLRTLFESISDLDTPAALWLEYCIVADHFYGHFHYLFILSICQNSSYSNRISLTVATRSWEQADRGMESHGDPNGGSGQI